MTLRETSVVGPRVKPSHRTVRWTFVVFAIALITRLLWIGVPLNVDEGLWMRRGPAFLQAVLQGNAPATYQRHHPGVTNMWIIGSAVAGRYLLLDALPPDELARQTAPELQQDFAGISDYLATVAKVPAVPLELFVSARLLAALVTAACTAGLYALSRRLFGPMVAAIAVAILLFEPFYLGYQRFLTTDANQTNFTWLALLSFLIALHATGGGRPGAWHETSKRGWGWALLSGICFGLAILSKVSALVSLPAFGIAFLWWSIASRTGASRMKLGGVLVMWSLAAITTAMLLWPALRVDPQGTVTLMFEEVGEEVAGHTQFFLGQSVLDPGPAFYPIVLLYRLSPLLLLGSILGLISLLSRSLRRHLEDPVSVLVILADLLFVLIGVSSVSSKLDRYIIPLLPGLALLAASGISALILRLDEKRGARGPSPFYQSRSGLALIAVLALQLAVLLPHIPYYVTYFNPLAGGPAVAQKLLMVGNGELMDRAGAWLRRETPSHDAVVGTWYADSFSPYFGGQTIPLNMSSEFMPRTWRLANFVILYINNIQRNFPDQLVEYFGPQRPLFEAKAHGISYVRVYPGPSVGSAGLAPTASPVDLNFDEYALLTGYELETPEVPAGEDAVLALYWKPLQSFPERDFTVHVGIRDAGGNDWGGIDGVPVGGMLPVDQWQPGQLLRDVQFLTVPPGTPPGEYDLAVSFWSPTLQRGLDIRNGDVSVGREAELAKLRVTLPSATPDLRADLGVTHLVEGEVQVAPGAARLLGYDASPPASAQAGEPVPLVILWQAGSREPADARLVLRLSQGDSHWQRAAGHPLGGGYSTAEWTPGQLVRDTWSALLPADAPAGAYNLELVSQTTTGDKVLLDLGPVDLLTRPHIFDKSNPTFAQDVSLSDTSTSTGAGVARLLGYDVPTAIQPGEELPLTLHWQAIGESEHDYLRFAHLLDAENHIVAQQDGVPVNGEAPVASWLPGEVLTDNVLIPVPSDLPKGRYRLAVGLYDPGSGGRLSTVDGREEILLSQEVEVR